MKIGVNVAVTLAGCRQWVRTSSLPPISLSISDAKTRHMPDPNAFSSHKNLLSKNITGYITTRLEKSPASKDRVWIPPCKLQLRVLTTRVTPPLPHNWTPPPVTKSLLILPRSGRNTQSLTILLHCNVPRPRPGNYKYALEFHKQNPISVQGRN